MRKLRGCESISKLIMLQIYQQGFNIALRLSLSLSNQRHI